MLSVQFFCFSFPCDFFVIKLWLKMPLRWRNLHPRSGEAKSRFPRPWENGAGMSASSSSARCPRHSPQVQENAFWKKICRVFSFFFFFCTFFPSDSFSFINILIFVFRAEGPHQRARSPPPAAADKWSDPCGGGFENDEQLGARVTEKENCYVFECFSSMNARKRKNIFS